MKVRENVVRIYDKLRQLELDMKHADEDKLPEMYAAYDRLNMPLSRKMDMPSE